MSDLLPGELAELSYADRTCRVVVGLGLRPGAGENELQHMQRFVRSAVDLRWTVVAIATIDTRARECLVVAAAAQWQVKIVTYTARQLGTVEVPNPSETVLKASGTASVAEAAALLGSAGGQLIVHKRSTESVSVAIARVIDRSSNR